MSNKLNKESFNNIINVMKGSQNVDLEFLYNVYEISFDTISELFKTQNIVNQNIDSFQLISYIFGEFVYSTVHLNDTNFAQFIENENIKYSMGSVSADKYISLSLFNSKEQKLTNSFLPPISSINLYVNLMINIVKTYHHNDPKNTLIVDLLSKTLSIARSIIGLLCDGYETQAFAIWRTLHECECTLLLMNKYGDIAINAYLKHMRFGMAYRNEIEDKDEQAKIMEQIKSEMQQFELKSKDTKKYIEYGWLTAIPESKTMDGFKLNFRDGLELLAGLHEKSDIYMTSSEILHSTPLLIYSNKNYFYFVTLLNLYESFFRIEEVFQPLFFSSVGEKGKESYIEMRKLYYSQLLNIYSREKQTFENSKN